MVKKKIYITIEDHYKTTQDIIDLIQAFRKELKNDINGLQGEFNSLRGEFSDFKKEIKNDIYNFKDEILSEIIKLRDDMTIVRGWSDRMEDHEVRIIKLEKKSLS